MTIKSFIKSFLFSPSFDFEQQSGGLRPPIFWDKSLFFNFLSYFDFIMFRVILVILLLATTTLTILLIPRAAIVIETIIIGIFKFFGRFPFIFIYIFSILGGIHL
jgi:hypothetical protein